MPLYEYFCLDCHERFEALRAMKDADALILCTKCKSEHTVRAISLFNAQSGGRVIAGNSSAGCAGCSSGSCSTCGR